MLKENTKDWFMKKMYIIALSCVLIHQTASAMQGLFDKDLFEAAQTGKATEFAELLKAKGSPEKIVHTVNKQDGNGWTLLHWIAYDEKKDQEIIPVLLANGALIDRKNRNGETPLHLAATFVNLVAMRTLLASKADVNMVAEFMGWTPLHYACRPQRIGADKSATLLLDAGAAADPVDNYKQTPLHLASCKHLDLVKILLQRGANIHAQNCDGRTPLHLAILHHELPIISFLLDSGADLNAEDNTGKTPLAYAQETKAQGNIQGFHFACQFDNLLEKANNTHYKKD